VSCVVTLHAVGGKRAVPLVKGTQPRRPVSWDVRAWFILPSGEKITHSAKVPGQTAVSLVPFVGALIDSLVADHGNEVRSCGWQAMTHGRK